jgi:hypothetical protein
MGGERRAQNVKDGDTGRGRKTRQEKDEDKPCSLHVQLTSLSLSSRSPTVIVVLSEAANAYEGVPNGRLLQWLMRDATFFLHAYASWDVIARTDTAPTRHDSTTLLMLEGMAQHVGQIHLRITSVQTAPRQLARV